MKDNLKEKIKQLKEKEKVNDSDIEKVFEKELMNRLLIYKSNLGYNISINKLDEKIKSFKDDFVLILIEKVRGNIFILPYWILAERIGKAKPRKNYNKFYYCKVNKDNSITLGGVRIRASIVKEYLFKYETELTEEDQRDAVIGEFKKYPTQVCIYIIIGGIFSSSFWALIEFYIANYLNFSLNMESSTILSFLLFSIIILVLYYVILRIKEK